MSLEQRTGLRPRDLELIIQAARHQPEIERLVLFGSRATGRHRTGSDVDLAVQGEQVSYATVLALADQLNEVLPLPYLFDVLDYNTISAPALREHIDRQGVPIYTVETGVS